MLHYNAVCIVLSLSKTRPVVESRLFSGRALPGGLSLSIPLGVWGYSGRRGGARRSKCCKVCIFCFRALASFCYNRAFCVGGGTKRATLAFWLPRRGPALGQPSARARPGVGQAFLGTAHFRVTVVIFHTSMATNACESVHFV